MPQRRAPVWQGEALAKLVWRLAKLGYGEYVKSFNPLSIGSMRWLTVPVNLPQHVASVATLFLLGKPIEREGDRGPRRPDR